MSGGYSPKSVGIVSSISGIVTNQVVSKEFPITAGGSLHFVAKVAASGVTVVGSITAKLQTAINGEYVDSKTVSISGNGNFYIKINVEVSGDQTYLPLLSSGRLVLTTTNSSDVVAIDSVDILQEI